jgi:hypothetical protein
MGIEPMGVGPVHGKADARRRDLEDDVLEHNVGYEPADRVSRSDERHLTDVDLAVPLVEVLLVATITVQTFLRQLVSGIRPSECMAISTPADAAPRR